jgi:hypothetical protein
MTDDTTTPREGTPDPSGPDELETTAADTESTQVLEQSAPTSELPSLTPEVHETPAAPEAAPLFPVEPLTPATPDPTPDPTVATPTTATPTPPASPVAPAPRALVTVRTGPRPGAILLGLLCLLVAGYTTARQTMDWRLDLNLVGPVSIGVLGTLLLLVGLIGLVSRRRS